MVVATRRIGVVRRAWLAPECEAGRKLFASLLAADESEISQSTLRMAPDEVHDKHLHGADLAVCVIEGRLVVEVGDRFSQRIELRPGDYVLIPREMRHREMAGADGAWAVVAHASEASS